MAQCSHCLGNFILLHISRPSSSACIVLGDPREFVQCNFLRYAEIDFIVVHICGYIFFRQYFLLSPFSKYGKIYVGLLRGLCHRLRVLILVRQLHPERVFSYQN